jgi:hypothetical protein
LLDFGLFFLYLFVTAEPLVYAVHNSAECHSKDFFVKKV